MQVPFLGFKHMNCCFQRSKTSAGHQMCDCAVPVMRWLSCLKPVLWYRHPIRFETLLSSQNWATSVSAIKRRLSCASQSPVCSVQRHWLSPAKDGPLGPARSQRTSYHSIPWDIWETSESSSKSPLKPSPNDQGSTVSWCLLPWCALSSLWTIIS